MPTFNSTTSRRALILGMTNTDQVGMWQARAPAAATIPDNAERLADAGDGADAESAGDVNEATGLTAEEQAAFEGMRTGDTPAGDPEPADGDGDVDPDATADGEDADADADGVGETDLIAPLAKEQTPEQVAADAAAGKRPAPKTVSFGKYQRELKKAGETAAAAQAEAKKAREDAIKLAERVAIINEALSAQPAAAVDPNAPPANPFEEADIDPAEDYAAAVQQERRRNKFAYEASQGIQQDVAVSREDQQMRDTFQRDFSAVSSSDPTVPLAYQFLKDSRLTEICISEFDKDPNDPNEVFTPQEVARMVQVFNAEEKYVVGNAIKAGKSPTAAILRLAKARGFKAPTAAAERAAQPAPANGTAVVPAARNGTGRAPVAPAAVSVVDQLAALAAAKEAGKSLSDGGGAPPESGLSAKMLLDMSPEEFEEFVDNLSAKEERQLNELMGRDLGSMRG